LESSKTIGELTTELGYIKPDGTPGYNVISRDLDILKKSGRIEGKKVKSKNGRKDSTLYSIIFSIENLCNILKEVLLQKFIINV